MTKPLEELNLHSLHSDRVALLLDFDGTLVELAERPGDVILPPETRATVKALSEQLDGALALVSGRSIESLDSFFAPLRLPAAGVHGLMRRDARGETVSKPVDDQAVALLGVRLSAFVEARPGLLLERKPGSLALHYRLRPDCEEACRVAMDKAVEGLDSIELLRGKMVIEAKAGTATKAGAVAEFMAEYPFRGRLPIVAGDDVTDEHAFEAVARLDGISIKVGRGETSALYRTADVTSFRGWLTALAAAFARHSA